MNDAAFSPPQESDDSHVSTPRFRPPSATVILRALLCLPLVCVSLLFTAIAIIGVTKLPAAERAYIPESCARAAEIAVVCLVLAAPAAAFRPSLIWLLPLGATASAGAAGWALLPLQAHQWMQAIEGAVLLLPVMVLVLGARWRLIPTGLAETAAAAGASPARVFLLARLRPAMPGIAWGLAVVFALALGLAPLLAPASGTP